MSKPMDAQTFLTAEAWINPDGEVFSAWCYDGPAAGVVSADAQPLRTAEGHVQRIDRNKLAEVIWQAEDDHVGAYGSTLLDFTVDAVLAALPELMGGEQA